MSAVRTKQPFGMMFAGSASGPMPPFVMDHHAVVQIPRSGHSMLPQYFDPTEVGCTDKAGIGPLVAKGRFQFAVSCRL